MVSLQDEIKQLDSQEVINNIQYSVRLQGIGRHIGSHPDVASSLFKKQNINLAKVSLSTLDESSISSNVYQSAIVTHDSYSFDQKPVVVDMSESSLAETGGIQKAVPGFLTKLNQKYDEFIFESLLNVSNKLADFTYTTALPLYNKIREIFDNSMQLSNARLVIIPQNVASRMRSEILGETRTYWDFMVETLNRMGVFVEEYRTTSTTIVCIFEDNLLTVDGEPPHILKGGTEERENTNWIQGAFVLAGFNLLDPNAVQAFSVVDATPAEAKEVSTKKKEKEANLSEV